MTDTATLEVYRSRSLLRGQRWRWRLVHDNGRVLACSSEGYANEGEARRVGTKVISGTYLKLTVSHS